MSARPGTMGTIVPTRPTAMATPARVMTASRLMTSRGGGGEGGDHRPPPLGDGLLAVLGGAAEADHDEVERRADGDGLALVAPGRERPEVVALDPPVGA